MNYITKYNQLIEKLLIIFCGILVVIGLIKGL
jgi:hypothetical protein